MNRNTTSLLFALQILAIVSCGSGHSSNIDTLSKQHQLSVDSSLRSTLFDASHLKNCDLEQLLGQKISEIDQYLLRVNHKTTYSGQLTGQSEKFTLIGEFAFLMAKVDGIPSGIRFNINTCTDPIVLPLPVNADKIFYSKDALFTIQKTTIDGLFYVSSISWVTGTQRSSYSKLDLQGGELEFMGQLSLDGNRTTALLTKQGDAFDAIAIEFDSSHKDILKLFSFTGLPKNLRYSRSVTLDQNKLILNADSNISYLLNLQNLSALELRSPAQNVFISNALPLSKNSIQLEDYNSDPDHKYHMYDRAFYNILADGSLQEIGKRDMHCPPVLPDCNATSSAILDAGNGYSLYVAYPKVYFEILSSSGAKLESYFFPNATDTISNVSNLDLNNSNPVSDGNKVEALLTGSGKNGNLTYLLLKYDLTLRSKNIVSYETDLPWKEPNSSLNPTYRFTANLMKLSNGKTVIANTTSCNSKKAGFCAIYIN